MQETYGVASSSVCIQISEASLPSIPSWLGEAAAFAQVLTHLGLLQAIQEHVRFARARFGKYDTIDFVVVLIGYAISGERTRDPPFTSDFCRSRTPLWLSLAVMRSKTRSTLSRFLAALDQASVEELLTLFLADLMARTPFPSPGGLVDRLGNLWWLVDVDARHPSRPSTCAPAQAGPSCPSSSDDAGLRSWLYGTQAGRSRENADHSFTPFHASVDRHLLRRRQWKISRGVATCSAGRDEGQRWLTPFPCLRW